ncbi:MAG: endonuclease III [Planctomycetota bacterium]|nr:MAG: endonuclease III [Planctomycetota bacterium]
MARKVSKRESKENRRKRAQKILRRLRRHFPEAATALDHHDPWQLLVATILSAQCTDERVNQVTPALFRHYPRIQDFAESPNGELEQLIRSTGFFNNKAKNIRGAARRVLEVHQGQVPDEMEALLALPGVARKTANCVLGTAFGKNVGVVVDTHVGRLARRFGFTAEKNPVKVERDLMELFPQKSWTYLSHALILHGRATCKARKADCESCKFADLCPQIEV